MTDAFSTVPCKAAPPDAAFFVFQTSELKR